MSGRTKILFIAVLLATPLLIYTCKDSFDWTGVSETSTPNQKSADVNVAISWFADNRPDSLVVGEQGAVMEVRPDWNKATVYSSRWLKTVEVELQAKNWLQFIPQENYTKWQDSGDLRYIMSTTRLIIRSAKRGNNPPTAGYYMSVSPSPEYLERTDFNPFDRVWYLSRDNRFSGLIMFHNLDGTFSNGWCYKNGKITHQLTSGGAIGTKAIVEICNLEVVYNTIFPSSSGYYYRYELYSPNYIISSYEYISSYTPSYSVYYFCNYYDDSTDGYESSGSAGGGYFGGGSAALSSLPDAAISYSAAQYQNTGGYIKINDTVRCNCKCAADKVMYQLLGENANIGSPLTAMQLWQDVNHNNVLQQVGDPNQIFNILNEHIDAGQPIIAGVNHSDGHPGNSDNTTDHFIVIIGRGYDTGTHKFYYTYVETSYSGANAANATSSSNRLYYDPATGTFENSNAYIGRHYILTQIRPNM